MPVGTSIGENPDGIVISPNPAEYSEIKKPSEGCNASIPLSS